MTDAQLLPPSQLLPLPPVLFSARPTASSAPPLHAALNLEEATAASTSAERSGRSLSARLKKSHRFNSPLPLGMGKKG